MTTYSMSPMAMMPEGEIPGTFRSKQGHSCCGGCCDMRRAVILCNMISILFAFLSLAGLEVLKAAIKAGGEMDDDVTKQASAAMKDFPIGVMILFMVVQCACYSMGVLGAISFTQWQVIVALVCHAILAGINLVSFNIPGILMAGFFAYPHVFFIKELRAGIMTPENYPNEVQSCCCV
jgi:hypothetical protein